MTKQVLFIHGWMNQRPEGAWQREVASVLRKQGHHVFFPQLPQPATPVFAEWAEVIIGELDQIREANAGEEVVVIGHSMGALAWLRLAASGLVATPVDRALLVAPALPSLLSDYPEFSVDLSSVPLESAARATYLVGGDEDPWQPNGIAEDFGKPLGLDSVVIPGAGHIIIDTGFGPWPGLVNWVNDPASDLSLR